MRKNLILLFCFSIASHMLLAQFSISTTEPAANSLGICTDTASFGIQIQATSGSATGVSIGIHMPPGISYVNSSLQNTGSATKNVSYTSFTGNILLLSGADMVIGDRYDFTFDVTASCAALSFFEGGNTFQDTIYVYYNGAQLVQDSTDVYNNAIAYAELSMPQPSTPSATIGQTVTRDVVINNSGDGCLDNFDWYDAFESDISIDSIYFNGSKLNTTISGDTIYYTFGSTEFSQIGNSDNQFCSADGSLTITEYIRLVGCTNKGSDLWMGWGCEGDTCNSYTTTGDVSFVSLQPSLAFSFRNEEMPACFHEQSNRKELIITNNGQGTASDIEVEIKKYYYAGQFSIYKYDGLDQNSVQLKYNNGSFSSVTPDNVEGNAYYNTCSQPYAYRFTVDVPDLAGGDSAVIAFDMINCTPTDCGEGEIRQGAWGYNYRYTLPCVGSSTVVSNQFAGIGGILTFEGQNYDAPTIAQNQEASFTSMVQEAQITYDGDGQYVVRYELPSCGLSFSGSSGDLTWTNIAGGLNWPKASFSFTGDTIEAVYDLDDQPNAFEMNGSEISLKLTGDCTCAINDTIQTLSKIIKYIPEQSCTSPAQIEIYCEDINVKVDPCSVSPCDGLQIGALSFARTTYGLPDADLDRRPELGAVDLDYIRIDRIRLGDTLTGSLMGYISGSSSFSYGYVDFSFDQHAYFSSLAGSLTIWDANGGGGSGAYINCDTLVVSTVSDSIFRVDFSPGSLSSYCGSLSGYSFEPGDTIWVYPLFRVDSTSTNDLDVGYINPVEMYVSSVANPSTAQRAECGSASFSAKFQIVPMVDATFVNQVAAHSCNQTQARTYINYFTAGSYLDMFPYEYRKWSFPDTLIVTPPDSFDFSSAYLFLRFYPYTYSLNPTPSYTSADTLLFDLRALINDGTLKEPDDGYEMQFFTYWDPQCDSEHNTDVNVPVEAKMNWEQGLEYYDTPKQYSPAIRHNAPALSLSNVSASTQDGLTSEVEWTLSLANSATNSNATYCFFGFYSPSGNVSVNRVVDDASAANLSVSNGIYQIGTLTNAQTKNYTIAASYTNCTLDSLYVYAGWNCGAYPSSLSGFTCEIDTFLLQVDPKPAAAQLSVVSTPSYPLDMCTDATYEFSISATQMANVEDLILDVYHPGGGVDWVTGSGQLEYPDGSGFTTISNPDTITGGFRYILGDYNATLASAGLEGLGGSTVANRTLNIRFDARTNCDFLSGDVFYVKLTGAKPCGDTINLVRVMDPISIDGVTAPYSMSLNNVVDTLPNCGEAVTMTIKLFPDGTTNSSDKVRITIPSGINYVSNSYTAIHNGPHQDSLTITDLGALGSRYEWVLPSGVLSGDSIIFTIDLDAVSSTGCNNAEYSVYVLATFEANVSCDGSQCLNYYGTTGAGSTFLTLDKTDLSLSNLNASISRSGANYIYALQGTLTNNGRALDGTGQTTIEFYCDSDSSLNYNTGDQYLGAYAANLVLGGGANTSISTSFSVDSTLCASDKPVLGIIRYNPQNGAPSQCLCDTLQTTLSTDVSLPLEGILLWGSESLSANQISWTILSGAEGKYELEYTNGDPGSPWKLVENQQWLKKGDLPKTYFWQHDLPENHQLYRIRFSNLNGQINYSSIIEIIRNEPFPVKIYPNPSNGIFQVETQDQLDYSCFDLLGKKLAEGQVPAGESRLSLSYLPKGWYLLSLQKGGQKKWLKIQIQ